LVAVIPNKWCAAQKGLRNGVPSDWPLGLSSQGGGNREVIEPRRSRKKKRCEHLKKVGRKTCRGAYFGKGGVWRKVKGKTSQKSGKPAKRGGLKGKQKKENGLVGQYLSVF